jgi:acyl-CoA synthetase (NDP forming)
MREVTGAEDAVRRLWQPESVAVVGASSRPGTLPWWPLHLMQQYGFQGRMYPVNPNRDQIDGIDCVPSVGAIDGAVDVAIIVQSAEATLGAVRECAEAGVRAVVLPAQGFGELGEAGRTAEAELMAAARSTGMRVVGPNTDGIANLATGALATIQPLFGQQFEVGDVAVVTQSGASAGSLISRLKREGIGCRLYASAGNEIDLGLADYLSVAVQDPGVKMVLSFVEAVRRPDDFVRVAELAAELGKPIVLIKVGRTEQAAQRAAAHTGALAGADRIYEALFRSLGVIRVDELSEVVAVAKLYLASGAPRSAGIGIMSVSGGQAGVLADLTAGTGVTVPAISAATGARLAELLPFGSPLNPCDLTGEVAKKPHLAAEVYRAFDDDDAIDTVVYARKELTGQAGREAAELLVQAATAGTASLVVYVMDGDANEDERATYRSHGVPIFASGAELVTAVAALARYAARPVPRSKSGEPPRFLLPEGPAGVLDELAAKALLGAYGIAFPQEALAKDAEAALEAAAELGYPVAMKIVCDRIPHKTEIGGVLLGVRGPDQVLSGFTELMERGRAALDGDEPDGVLVQQQIEDGVEFIAGLVVDEQFGPFILVGTGGVMTELLDDAVLRPAPVSPDEAVQMLDELRGRRLLDGFRGAPPADVDALAATVSALSHLGADHAASLAEVDLNPVLVRPLGAGALAADALVVRRERSAS